MTAPIITVGRDELKARRERILVELGLTAEEFERRIAIGSLSGEEWTALEELDEIAFLLGESPA